MGKRNRSNEDVTINLTPMIDVVFLLVIFFMVGSKFSESESAIDVSVPAVGPANPISRVPDDRVVSLTRDGQIMLNDQPVTKDQLVQQLTNEFSQYPALNVIVRADSDTPIQQYASIALLVRQSGVKKIAMAVKVDQSGGVHR
ncbi:ExbD/TolR family protein [Roseiconus lacunae]|uniref:Biopolymer transporter ExbD n=1 Tax=Roseiconus lacunae TaxID=2605694 RepID=A0ABT7PDK4_9BACT|nr:biopolymer transporter ExbD [Roseiconus lacunae]MCD0459890.1 biopolymer transporter ExbD [Roseiconus lacunae]MDM4014589.1 biopolymer transporter ExbD [Roseiconus lacunae]WRQ49909.1 biopolymer transporter ExbD [Stieleria sp. HD01]